MEPHTHLPLGAGVWAWSEGPPVGKGGAVGDGASGDSRVRGGARDRDKIAPGPRVGGDPLSTCVTRNPYCHSKTIRFVKFAATAVLFAEYLLAYAIVILVHKSRTLAATAPGYAGACLLKERPSWGWATRRSPFA